jgi:hypothetical protein
MEQRQERILTAELLIREHPTYLSRAHGSSNLEKSSTWKSWEPTIMSIRLSKAREFGVTIMASMLNQRVLWTSLEEMVPDERGGVEGQGEVEFADK